MIRCNKCEAYYPDDTHFDLEEWNERCPCCKSVWCLMGWWDFKSPFNLHQDHIKLKKQIKEWELELDDVRWRWLKETRNTIEYLSHEMCAINM